MKNALLFCLLTLFFAACEDKVTGDKVETREVRRPGVCPPSSPYPDPPAVTFAGAQSVDSINQNGFFARWNKAQDASGYLVYLQEPGEEMRVYKSLGPDKDSAEITGLAPDTEYKVSVRMLDERGLYDLNETVLAAATNNRPAYNNARSLYFDGFSSVALKGADEIFPGNLFTVSIWFKTAYRQDALDARLINLHQGPSAGSALTIGARKNQLFLGYRDGDGSYKEIKSDFVYHDDQWHHVAATYNGKYLVLYINGHRIKMLQESFIGFGSHPAHIGSYTGNKKGFTGLIDEVSLWTTAMSSNSVQEIYNKGASNNLYEHSRSNSLKVWHRLGDDPGDSASGLFDQMDFSHGSTLNIEAQDFTHSAP